MHQEGQDTRRQNVILHVGIPCCPQPLKYIQVNIVFRDIVELAPVGVFRR